MTVVALLADPPRAGRCLPALVEEDVCTAAEAADLYGAMVQDAAVAVARSGGDLLVNHPPASDFQATRDPDAESTDVAGSDDVADSDDVAGSDDDTGTGPVDPEAALRDLLGDVLAQVDGIDDVDDVRFEVQVGATGAARIGNTVTHLLEAEGATSAAVLRPTAPLVDRTVIDAAAMKLRRNQVVLGPATEGRIYVAGFTDPIDFEDALAPPPVETLADRGAGADLGVGFEAVSPLLETPGDVGTVLPLLRARERTAQPVPAATARALDRIGVTRRDRGATPREDADDTGE